MANFSTGKETVKTNGILYQFDEIKSIVFIEIKGPI